MSLYRTNDSAGTAGHRVKLMTMVLVPIVMQCHTVELEEWVRGFVSGSRESTIQRNPFHVRTPVTSKIHTLTLLEVAEIHCIDATAGMGDNGRLHVTNQGPLSGTEEWVCLNVGGTGSGTKSAILVLDQELPDERFAEAEIRLENVPTTAKQKCSSTYFEIWGAPA